MHIEVSKWPAPFWLQQIAAHGWKLLPEYRLDTRTGAYTHSTFQTKHGLHSINDIFQTTVRPQYASDRIFIVL